MASALLVAQGIVLTILAFGLMIFVHELGHFLAAKLIRVRVDVFSFGFGPRLFGHKWGDTDYMVSAIPLGGYVKMAGGDEGEEAKGAPDEFVSKSPGQRTLVLVAGPLFSILFGIPLAMAMLIVGRDTPGSTVSYVAVGSPAWDAGVKYGDRITSLGSRPVATFEGLRQAIHECPYGEPLELVVEREGRNVTLSVTRPKGKLLGVHCTFPLTTVRRAEPDTPAAAAGLRKGDVVLEVNRQPVKSWLDFRRAILPNPDRSVELTIERGGERLAVPATPQGRDAPDPGFTIRLPAEVGFVRKGFPADGKLQVGDRITAVNGNPVEGWWDIEDAVLRGPSAVTLGVLRGKDRILVPPSGDAAQLAEALATAMRGLAKQELTVRLTREEGEFLVDSLGIAPRPAYEVVGIHRQAEPPLQPGDLVVAANGLDLAEAIPEQAVYMPLEEAVGILGSETKDVRLTVLRRHADGPPRPQLTLNGLAWEVGAAEEELAVTVKPGTRKLGHLGVERSIIEVRQKETFFGSFVPAIERTIDISTFAFRVIGRLFQRDVPLSDIMGPLGIVQVTYGAATRGWADLFWLIHLITVNIGVFNLLPLPPLDGGRVVMVAYEKVRGKRPSRKVQEAIILAGFAFVVVIFLVATFNDLTRLFF
ncbi:MAG: RIP metalloprotease RseP [Planctomycetes bacterium]|nr:RIP metalloprotease RseP [Planctomycetota bacterium]